MLQESLDLEFILKGSGCRNGGQPSSIVIQLLGRNYFLYICSMQDLGRAFYWQKPLFHCVNKAVVDIWSKHTAKCPQIANLLHELFFTAAKHNFTVNVSHIPGTSNVLADALFHSQGRRFFQLAPRSQSTANKDFPSSLEYLKRELELLHNFSQYQRVQERHTYKVPPAKTSRPTASGVGQQ